MWFGFQTLYDPYFISLYNLMYTALPVLVMGLLDQVFYTHELCAAKMLLLRSLWLSYQKKDCGCNTDYRFVLCWLSRSPEYETSVDLWSDTIAMVWPFPHIPRLFYSSLNPFKDKINCLFMVSRGNPKGISPDNIPSGIPLETINKQFILSLNGYRAVKQARDVWKWSNHGNIEDSFLTVQAGKLLWKEEESLTHSLYQFSRNFVLLRLAHCQWGSKPDSHLPKLTFGANL